MTYSLFRATGIIITLTLLLTVFVGPVHASDAVRTHAENGEQADETALVCLGLVGGTAILAGGMWLGKLRSMLS